MSSWVAFLVAFAYVVLGYALAMFFTNRGSSKTESKSAESDQETAPEDEPAISGDQAADFLERIQNLTSHVDHDVNRHATRVAQISGGLQGGDVNQSSAVVLAAAAQILEANLQLQQDLLTAQEEIQTQKKQLESYMTAALTDPLTGLANRRKFDQELNRRFAQWKKGGSPLTLVLVDVDNFKSFNDEHGHQAGDAVLQEVAAVLADSVRAMDLVARYGGEEFGLILPGTTLDEARPVAERVRGAVEQSVFQYGQKNLQITVSAGMAEAMLTNSREVLLKRADSALYSAKELGRNLCAVHDGQTSAPLEKVARQQRRRADRNRQRIAPFIDGNFPEPGMFRDVECEELDARGFKFLSQERPDFDKVLVAIGSEEQRSFTTASVAEVRNIGTDDEPVFRVSCRFTVAVDRFAEAEAG